MVTRVLVVTLMAAWLSNTIIRGFTSMLAFKSNIEVKDYQMSDLYSYLAKSDAVNESQNVVLIHVDDMGSKKIAEVINFVKSANPKAIGVDITFKNPHSDDSLIISAVNDSNIVLAYWTENDGTQTKPYFMDDNSLFSVGDVRFTNRLPIEPVRNYRPVYNVVGYPSHTFADALAEKSGERSFVDEDTASALIYYPNMEFLILTSDDIVDNPEKCRIRMRDKIVIIGDTSDSQDMHFTPLGLKPGLKIQAHIIENMLGYNPIQKSSSFCTWSVAAVLCAMLVSINIVLTSRKMIASKLLFRLAQLSLLILSFVVGSFLFARKGLYVDVSPMMGMVAMSLLVDDVLVSIVSLLTKKHIKQKTYI